MQKRTSEMGFSENFTSIHVFSTFVFKYLLDSFLMQDGCPIYVTRIKDLVWSLDERTFKTQLLKTVFQPPKVNEICFTFAGITHNRSESS